MLPFLTAAFENSWGHGVVGCTIAAIMACLDQHIQIFSRGRKMTRAFAFLFAAMVVLAGAGQAIRYGSGVGRDGFRWGGTHRISAKKEWPSWTPPAQMLRRRPGLPRHMSGGIDNPLGARAMYLAGTLYRIHGSNEPDTIGQAVSSGCIRMTNQDVTDLYERARVGAKVVVLR